MLVCESILYFYHFLGDIYSLILGTNTPLHSCMFDDIGRLSLFLDLITIEWSSMIPFLNEGLQQGHE
jgi:hypothetical protein